MKIVYAHTDSIYIPIDGIDKAKEVCKEINTKVQEAFPNVMGLETHPVQLEFEKFYKSFGVGCKKNRNAGYISWKDGKYLDEPEFIVTGYSMKRRSESKICRDFQRELLQRWVSEETQDKINMFCKEIYNDAKHGRYEIKDIVKQSRVRRKMEDYKAISGGIAGVCYYNQHIEPDNPIEDSFLHIQCSNIIGPQFIILPNGKERKASYISVKEMKEFNKNYTPDWGAYASAIVKKAKPIFEAMGWNVKEFMIDEKQRNLGEWM
tara:strand:- start:1031 stop:1819 length:789 start_codon:yes stop_codon:yes gene_type:complete